MLAGASLAFLPLGIFVRRIVTDRQQRLDMPPMLSRSLERRP